MVSLEHLTCGDFSTRLNEVFRLTAEDGREIDLELIEATPLGEDRRDPASSRSFSLVFRGPAGLYLPQRIYPLENAEMGRLEIFLAPIFPDQTGARFEAVFSRR